MLPFCVKSANIMMRNKAIMNRWRIEEVIQAVKNDPNAIKAINDGVKTKGKGRSEGKKNLRGKETRI